MPTKYLFTTSAILFLYASPLLAASYDCAKAKTKVEHLVCDTQLLSSLDEMLAKDYQVVLANANKKQKQQAIQDQRHWLVRTRNACQTVTCLKHAYWSRQAALETYFLPRTQLYNDEAEKAAAIQKVLKSANLGQVYNHRSCSLIYDGLINRNGIKFINPVVQAQSYQDPALDSWKKSCQSAPPFNFSFFCEPNIEPADGDDVTGVCKVSYGLPPFKIYVLPPKEGSHQERIIFYNDDAYGYMNRSYRKKSPGSGFVGFRQISPSKCLSVFGNRWDSQGKVDWGDLTAYLESTKSGANEENYNSLILHNDEYYFLVLYKEDSGYRMTVKSVAESKRLCRWVP